MNKVVSFFLIAWSGNGNVIQSCHEPQKVELQNNKYITQKTLTGVWCVKNMEYYIYYHVYKEPGKSAYVHGCNSSSAWTVKMKQQKEDGSFSCFSSVVIY